MITHFSRMPIGSETKKVPAFSAKTRLRLTIHNVHPVRQGVDRLTSGFITGPQAVLRGLSCFCMAASPDVLGTNRTSLRQPIPFQLASCVQLHLTLNIIDRAICLLYLPLLLAPLVFRLQHPFNNMASKVWKRILYIVKIGGWISTMPWVCLQAPIEQILQEPDSIQQEKQLLEWQVRKNSELQMVSFAVSTPTPQHSPNQIMNVVVGNAHSLGRYWLDPVVIPRHRSLDRRRDLVQHAPLQPHVRHHGFLPDHSSLELRAQERWQRNPA